MTEKEQIAAGLEEDGEDLELLDFDKTKKKKKTKKVKKTKTELAASETGANQACKIKQQIELIF